VPAARAGDRLLPASPPATATGWRRCRSAPALLARPPGARLVGARGAPCPRPSSPTATRSRARSTSTPSPPPTSAACCATAASSSAESAGEELLANAWGWVLRTVESSAEPQSVSFGWRRFAFRSYIALQKVDTRLLEPRLPAELFYNLLVSGRKPG
jgi:hypothetical protein